MSDIQRYDWVNYGMTCEDDGEFVDYKDHIAKIQELLKLIDAAVCPCCDKSGAYYDDMGEVRQCQWCHEVAKLREGE